MTNLSLFLKRPNLAVILLLASLAASISSGTKHYAQAPAERTEAQGEKAVVGILVTRVDTNSPAARAGLAEDDLITHYGTLPVLDGASYHAARAAYLKRTEAQVNLRLWRAGKQLTLSVPKGRLGFHSRDANPVWDELYHALQSDELARAQQLRTRAAQTQTLTPAQLLIADILLIPDRAAPDAEQRRAQLLKQFLAAYPLDFIRAISYEQFYQMKRFTAASACFEQQLKDDPRDVGTWLNLGNAYNSLWRFADAARAADYVSANRLPLSAYGQGVLDQVRGSAALGLGDYLRALDSYRQSFAARPTDHKMAMWLLAAALLGDGPKFYEIARQCRAALPEPYARLQHHLDALEAYLLVKNNQRAQAQALLARWKESEQVSQNIAEYWPRFPRGAEIVSNWQSLLNQ